MSNALTTLSTNLAQSLGLGDAAGAELLSTLKATAFKGPATDAQLTALLIVAKQYGLNPWTKEIYAFPDKNNGIVPVVGVDGWSRIINGHPQFDGVSFDQNNESCTCRIFRKDRSHPTEITEFMSECYRDLGPWKSHKHRMLRHKALIQCARLAFGFVGVYDEDEAERISEVTVKQRPVSPVALAQQNQAVEPEQVDSEERTRLIAHLEQAASFGVDAYAEEWTKLEKPQRVLIGSDEHARLKALAANQVQEAEITEGEGNEV